MGRYSDDQHTRRWTWLCVVLACLLCTAALSESDVICDGADDELNSAALSTFMSASVGAMSVWFTPSGAGVDAATCWQGRKIIGDAGGYIGMTLNDIALINMCGFNYDGSTIFTGDRLLTVGTASHLMLTHTGGTLVLYINGAPVETLASGNTDDLSNPFQICSAGSGAAGLGTFSQVTVYSTVPTVGEIAVLGTSKTRRLTKTVPSGLWEFAECAPGANCNGVVFKDTSWHSQPITGNDGLNNAGLTGKASGVLRTWGGMD